MTVTQMRAHRPDYLVALSIFSLMSIGLIMMYAISPVLSHKLLGSASRNYYFYNQLLYTGVGIAAWMVSSNLYYKNWQRFTAVIVALTIVSLVALLIPGLNFTKNGATRWVKLGPLSFQPAEFIKLSLVLYLAKWFDRRRDDVTKFSEGLVPFTILVGVTSFIVVVMQRDMGTMMVIALSALGMYYVAGAKTQHMLSLLGAGLGAGILAVAAFPHRMARFMTFLDPSKDTTGAGYHINQALIAIGTGGLFGVGLGKSIQVYGYLPEASNDSIFAIIAEEFGLFGSLIVVGLFGALVFRGLRVAKYSSDRYAQLLATGISLWFLFQSVINIAAMLSLVPLTGIPLPFVSYGGSSLVISLVAAGILLNISKYTTNEAAYANPSERRRQRWPHLAGAGNARGIKNTR